MATSALPALIDALFEGSRAALPNVGVYDGFAVTNDTGDHLFIGVDDPDNQDGASSATTQQAWANANHTARDESGDVTCAALSWNGDGDMKAARDAAYATCAAVENLLRANPALGVPSLLWTSFGTSQSLTQDQTDDGALALVVFTVSFRARI